MNNVKFIGRHALLIRHDTKKVIGTLQGTDFTSWAGYVELTCIASHHFYSGIT